MFDLSMVRMNEEVFVPWSVKEEHTLEEEHEFNYLEILETPDVEKWVSIINPVIGTCRSCGHRCLVDDPSLGLYSNRGRRLK